MIRLMIIGWAMILLPCYAAAESLPTRGEVLAFACISCHQTTVQPLAGRNDIAILMRAFRTGERDGAIMNLLAQGYNDAEIDAIAIYFAALSP